MTRSFASVSFDVIIQKFFNAIFSLQNRKNSRSDTDGGRERSYRCWLSAVGPAAPWAPGAPVTGTWPRPRQPSAVPGPPCSRRVSTPPPGPCGPRPHCAPTCGHVTPWVRARRHSCAPGAGCVRRAGAWLCLAVPGALSEPRGRSVPWELSLRPRGPTAPAGGLACPPAPAPPSPADANPSRSCPLVEGLAPE